MSLLHIETAHLNYIDGMDLLKLMETAKSVHEKFNGKSQLWKFIYENEFGKVCFPSCEPHDYKRQYICDWHDFNNSVLVSRH